MTPLARLQTVLTAALLSIALGACKARTVIEAEEFPQRHDPTTDKYAVFENASKLAARLRLEQVARDPDAVPTVVQFSLRNASKDPVDFMYRCKWLDKNGLEIPYSTEAWIRCTLQGKERTNLRCPAPKPEAVDYRLVLHDWKRK